LSKANSSTIKYVKLILEFNKQTFNYKNKVEKDKRVNGKKFDAKFNPPFFLFHFSAVDHYSICSEAENLQTLQTPVSGKQGILPELSRALHLESGILGKRRLSVGDDSADFYGFIRLALFLFRDFFREINSIFQ